MYGFWIANCKEWTFNHDLKRVVVILRSRIVLIRLRELGELSEILVLLRLLQPVRLGNRHEYTAYQYIMTRVNSKHHFFFV